MNRRFESDWWAIGIADGWDVDDDDSCTTLTRLNEDGAFQISAARKDAESVTEEDALEFASDSVPDGTPFERTSVGSFEGIRASFSDERGQWVMHWLFAGPLLVYATHVGAPEIVVAQSADVRRMLETLEPMEST